MPKLKQERKCSVDGCEKKHEAKGYCIMHYRRVTRYGMIESTYDPVVRFHKNYNRDSKTDCWMWTGWTDNKGYGGLMHKNKPLKAHRLSWEIHKGPIPEGLYVCHHCDTPPCVNPDHLFVGTAKDNTHDAIKKGRMKPRENAAKIPRINGRFATKASAIRGYFEGRV